MISIIEGRALIWYWDHLKNFIVEIPQGPSGIPIGTIQIIQKGSRGPKPGVFDFLGFDRNIIKTDNWLSQPHFLADFQVSYHFGKLLTARSQGITASKNQSIDQ